MSATAVRWTHSLPLLLALITAVGPISTDMYLPAFPAMREGLHGGESSSPLTLAAWFVGLAAGQLLVGPLSDRFGRRIPLLAGIALYVLASAACALAGSMPALIVFRALAALGGAAGLVIPRAIIRDVVTNGDHAARLVSQQQLIMSIVPMLAPTLGGVVVQVTGWRSIFWIAVCYGLTCLLLVWRTLPETCDPGSRITADPVAVGVRYADFLGDRVFVTHLLTGSFATFGLFAFLGGAPAVFLLHFGLRPAEFGLLFIANGAAYAAGTWVNVVAIRHLDRFHVLSASTLTLIAAAGSILLCAATGRLGFWGIEGPMILVMVTLGCLLPDAAIGAIMPHGGDAGIASAPYGTGIFAIGALGTIGAGWVGHASAAPMAALILLGGSLSAVASGFRPQE